MQNAEDAKAAVLKEQVERLLHAYRKVMFRKAYKVTQMVE